MNHSLSVLPGGPIHCSVALESIPMALPQGPVTLGRIQVVLPTLCGPEKYSGGLAFLLVGGGAFSCPCTHPVAPVPARHPTLPTVIPEAALGVVKELHVLLHFILFLSSTKWVTSLKEKFAYTTARSLLPAQIVSITETGSIINNFPVQIALGSNEPPVNSSPLSYREILWKFHNLFQNTEAEGAFPCAFYEASISVSPEPEMSQERITEQFLS